MFLLDRRYKVIDIVDINKAISLKRRQSLEGEDTLTMEYPLSIYNFKENYHIYYKDMVYRIINIDKGIDAIKIYAESIYYDLGTEKVKTLNLTTVNAGLALSQALEGTDWEVGIVQIGNQRTLRVTDLNPLQIIVEINKIWGGELRFRVTMSDTGIDRLYVDILERKGNNNGLRYELDYNLEDIGKVVDVSEIATALIPRAFSEELNEEGNPIAFGIENIEWSVANGDPVDKPLGQDWIGCPDTLEKYGTFDTKGNPKHIFRLYESQARSPEELIFASWLALSRRKIPVVNIECKVLNIGEVQLGDTVYVITPNDRIEARVISCDIDDLEEENTDIELGQFRTDLTDKLKEIAELANMFIRKEPALETKQGAKERVEELRQETEVQFNVLEDRIEARVTNEVAGLNSAITQTADQIRMEVNNEFNNVNSTISQQANEIALRVRTIDYNGNTIASLINQTATTVTIEASRINLQGAVTISALGTDTVQLIDSKETPTGAQQKANDAQQNAINHANTVANNARTNAREDLALSLGYNSYNDMVVRAVNGQTIIQGGFIRTSLLDVNAILANFVRVSTSLIVGNGNNLAGISGLGISATDIRFWAGSATSSWAPFRVSQDGRLVAGANSSDPVLWNNNLNTSFRGVFIPSQLDAGDHWDGIINRGGSTFLAARWKFDHSNFLRQDASNFAVVFGTSAFTVDNLGNARVFGNLRVDGNLTGVTLSASDIPSLDASKITSGTFTDARIPNLDASKITSGEFARARIPTLDASIITAGTLNFNRLPVGTGSTQVAAGNHTHTSFGALAINGGLSVTNNVTLGATIVMNPTTQSTGSANMILVASNDSFAVRRITSSIKYKQDVENFDSPKLLDARPVRFRGKSEIAELGENAPYGLGLIAEEIHDLGLNELVVYDSDGNPDGVNYDRIAVALLPIIKQQQQEINELKQKVEQLRECV